MVKKNSNARNSKRVEVDVLVKGGRAGNGARNRKRRARGGGMQDVARSYGSGYQIQQRNTSLSVPGGMGFSVPRGMSMVQRGDIITVRKCEVFSLARAGTAEDFYTPAANALVPSNVPWLTGVAANFSKWRWRRLAIKYTSTVGTTTSGLIGRGFGYDMAELPATAFVQVAAFDQFKAGPIWASWDEPIVMDTGRFSRDWYPYIGTGAFTSLSANDQNVYSPGYLAAFSGISSLTAEGDVGIDWIEYEVDLCDPISSSLQPDT